MKWKPFSSGTPYTCKDCPAYVELRADRDRWRDAADEVDRLRAERLDWFLVARQFRDVVLEGGNIVNAVDEYLRVRGRLEDPRDCQRAVHGD